MITQNKIYWYNTGKFEAEWSELLEWSDKQGTADETKGYLPKGYLFARAVWLYNMLYRNGGSNIESDEWHKVFRGISLKDARYNSPINLNNKATQAIEDRLDYLLIKAHKEYKKVEAFQDGVAQREKFKKSIGW